MRLFSINLGGGSSGAVWGSITGTLSNQLDLQAALNAKISAAGSSVDNAQARWNGTGGDSLQNGKWIEDDNGHVTVDMGDTGSTTTRYGLYPTMTLNGSTASSINAWERLDLSTSGSGAGAFILGRWVRLLSGYTGSGMSVGDWVINGVSGTGTDLNGGSGTMGYRCSMSGASGTGYAAAYYGTIPGIWKRAWGSLQEIDAAPSADVGIGHGSILAVGSGTYKPVGFFAKFGAVGAIPSVAGCFVGDNGSSTHPGIVLQDNGTSMFEVQDGGIVKLGATSTTPKHILNTDSGTPASDVLTLTNGPSGLAGNPAVYIKITVNGTDRYIPAW